MGYAWNLRGLVLLLPGLVLAFAVRGDVARRGLWGIVGAVGLPAAAVLPWAMAGVYRPWLGVGGTIVLTVCVAWLGWRDRRRHGPDAAWREDPWPDVLALAMVLPVALCWGWSHPWPHQWNSHYTLALQMGEWVHAHGAFPSLADIGTRYTISPALYPPQLHAAAAVTATLGRNALITWATAVGALGLCGLAFGVAALARACGLRGTIRAFGILTAIACALAWGPYSYLFFLLTEFNQDTLLFAVAGLVVLEGLHARHRLYAESLWRPWVAVFLVGWVRQPLLPLALAWVLALYVWDWRRQKTLSPATAVPGTHVRALATATAVALGGLGWCAYLWLRYGSPLYPFRFGQGVLRGLYAFDEPAWRFFQGPDVALYPGSALSTLSKMLVGPAGAPLWLRVYAVDGLLPPIALALGVVGVACMLRNRVTRGTTLAMTMWVAAGVAYWYVLPGRGSIKPVLIVLPAVCACVALGGASVLAAATSRLGRAKIPSQGLAAVLLVLAILGNGWPHRTHGIHWAGWLHAPRTLETALLRQYGEDVYMLLRWLKQSKPRPETVVMFNNEHSGLLFFLTDATPIWSIDEYRTDLYAWHVPPDVGSLRETISASGKRWLFAPDRPYLENWIASNPQMALAAEQLVHALYGETLGYVPIRNAQWRLGYPVSVYDLSRSTAARLQGENHGGDTGPRPPPPTSNPTQNR